MRLVALVFCVGILAAGTSPGAADGVASFPPETIEGVLNPPAAWPTFAERVVYQRAIEEVYWRHRIWPKENWVQKPRLDAMVSLAQLEEKVKRYLQKSRLVTERRGFPITSSELQAEMERMAADTKQPEVLRELFEALGNNPFVIAECLSRPALAERLSADPTGVAGVLTALEELIAAETFSTENRIGVTANVNDPHYKLPEVFVANDCSDDNWTDTTTVNVPDIRADHTAVWTGSEMIIWGGYNTDGGQVNTLNTGGRYNPATDTWTATSSINAPTGRAFHTAVWTGSEIIIWGGYNYPSGDLSSGGRYNPTSDSWTATNGVDAPEGRESHTAVWTGTEMIIWAGAGCTFGNCLLNTGATYNPSTDTWAFTNVISAPVRRFLHKAVWTGTQMIVWGGSDSMNYLHTGGKYDPSTDSWTTTGVLNVPLGRIADTAVWTGDGMIVWGGVDETFNDTNTGGRYNPSTDSWTATSLANAPSARDSHSGVWTGSEMIVWAGVFCCPVIDFNTGGRYNAATDSWTATSTVNAPLARWAHTAVWTGTEMLVWGGYNDPSQIFLNTGGRYYESVPTPTPTATATPTPTASATATPRTTPAPRARPTPRARP